MHSVPPRLTLQRLITIASFLLALFPTLFIHPCLTFTLYPFCSESLFLLCRNTSAPCILSKTVRYCAVEECIWELDKTLTSLEFSLWLCYVRTMAWSPNSNWYSALKSSMIHLQDYLFSTFTVQVTNLHWSVQEDLSTLQPSLRASLAGSQT